MIWQLILLGFTKKDTSQENALGNKVDNVWKLKQEILVPI